MSQVDDYIIPGTPLTMAELKTVLDNSFAALGSDNRGATAPSNPFEGMYWQDSDSTPNELIKKYTVTDGWVILASINTTTGVLIPYRSGSPLGNASIKTVGVASGNLSIVNQAVTDKATATNVTLGTTLNIRLTGTTTITGFTGVAGVTYHCRANGAFTLTHHATNLIITQGGASITTAAGDTFDVQMITTTTARIVNYVIAEKIVRTKIIDIGDWNMTSVGSVNIAHGLTHAKIRSVSAFILNDSSNITYSLLVADTAAVTGRFSIGTSHVTLVRHAGFFANGGFSSTSYNRGWITIQYVD